MTSPFDEARYRALLEGLEISEILFSSLDKTKRIDSEYFRKSLLKLEKDISSQPHDILENKGVFVTGPFGSEFHVDNYEEKTGFRYVRGKDVKPFFVESGDNVYIPEKDYKRLDDYSLVEGDILISVVGTLGNASIVTRKELPAIYSCKSTVFRSADTNPWFLIAYLNSMSGQSLLLRKTLGAVQTGLNLSDLKELLIPDFNRNFQEIIADTTKEAYDGLQKSYELYNEAEQTLLRTLGLEDWQPPEVLTYERKAADVFAVGRLDAEHFQPKYDELYKQIKRTGIETRRLEEIILPVMNGFDCRDFVEVGTPYIRVGDIKKGRIDLESAFQIPLTADKIGKDVALQIGDVLFTRKGSFGNAAPVWNEAKHAVISSEIMLLRFSPVYKNAVLPEYLALFLNSVAGNIQAEKWAHGAAFYSIMQDDLGQFVIPLISKPEQEALRDLIMQSEAARKQARFLLDRAKRAVEIAIEENEEAAAEFLKQSQGVA